MASSTIEPTGDLPSPDREVLTVRGLRVVDDEGRERIRLETKRGLATIEVSDGRGGRANKLFLESGDECGPVIGVVLDGNVVGLFDEEGAADTRPTRTGAPVDSDRERIVRLEREVAELRMFLPMLGALKEAALDGRR